MIFLETFFLEWWEEVNATSFIQIEKDSIFFQKQADISDNFESYLSLLKSPKFMSVIVPKYVYTAPAFTLPPVE